MMSSAKWSPASEDRRGVRRNLREGFIEEVAGKGCHHHWPWDPEKVDWGFFRGRSARERGSCGRSGEPSSMRPLAGGRSTRWRMNEYVTGLIREGLECQSKVFTSH